MICSFIIHSFNKRLRILLNDVPGTALGPVDAIGNKTLSCGEAELSTPGQSVPMGWD